MIVQARHSAKISGCASNLLFLAMRIVRMVLWHGLTPPQVWSNTENHWKKLSGPARIYLCMDWWFFRIHVRGHEKILVGGLALRYDPRSGGDYPSGKCRMRRWKYGSRFLGERWLFSCVCVRSPPAATNGSARMMMMWPNKISTGLYRGSWLG